MSRYRRIKASTAATTFLVTAFALLAVGCQGASDTPEQVAALTSPEVAASPPDSTLEVPFDAPAVTAPGPLEASEEAIAAAEQELAAREAELARRELAAREAAVAAREAAVARRETELAGQTPAAPAVPPAPAAEPTPRVEPEPREEETAAAPLFSESWRERPPAAATQPPVPAGTRLAAELESGLSTVTGRLGDPVGARLSEDLVVEGRTILAAGARLEGEVVEIGGGKKIGGKPRLAVTFNSVERPDGVRAAVVASLRLDGRNESKRDAATIGGSAAGGAVLGRVIGDDKGSTVAGALIGAAVGTAVAARTRSEIELPAGTPLELVLEQELIVPR